MSSSASPPPPLSTTGSAVSGSRSPTHRSSVKETLLYAIDLLKKSDIEKQHIIDRINEAQQRGRDTRTASDAQSHSVPLSAAFQSYGLLDDTELIQDSPTLSAPLSLASSLAQPVTVAAQERDSPPAARKSINNGSAKSTSTGTTATPVKAKIKASSIMTNPPKPPVRTPVKPTATKPRDELPVTSTPSSRRASGTRVPLSSPVVQQSPSKPAPATPGRRSGTSTPAKVASPVVSRGHSRASSSPQVVAKSPAKPVAPKSQPVRTQRASLPPAPSPVPSQSSTVSEDTASNDGEGVDDSSILQTYVRFIFSPAYILTLRPPHLVDDQYVASGQRYESLEWLRVDNAESEDFTSVHTVNLHADNDSDELTIIIDTKTLVDSDMQKQLCFQLWSHSKSIDDYNNPSGAEFDFDNYQSLMSEEPQHDLLEQFSATIPELAAWAGRGANGRHHAHDSDNDSDDFLFESPNDDDDDDEDEQTRRQKIGQFFRSVEVILQENEKATKTSREKRAMEARITKERIKIRKQKAATVSSSASGTKSNRSSLNRSLAPGTSSSSSAQPTHPLATAPRSLSLIAAATQSSLAASIAGLSITDTPEEFADLITPERVFARRQRVKIEKAKKQRHSNNNNSSSNSGANSRVTSRPSTPDSINDSEPAPVPVYELFDAEYFRVCVHVHDLPKMNFSGSTDSYFHILLSSQSEPLIPNTTLVSSLHSLYRSEVQFNSLTPRFASFVLSSVRERDRERAITLRMINWRQRVSEGHEEVIGECTLTLGELIPTSTAEPIPSLTLELRNSTRSFLAMKSARVGLVTMTFTPLSASPTTIDTAPSSVHRSPDQIKRAEKREFKKGLRESAGINEDKNDEREHQLRGSAGPVAVNTRL